MNTEVAKIEKDLQKMRDNIYNTFDAFLGARRPQSDTDYEPEWVPLADVTEDKDGFTLRAALPGVRKEDVETEIKDNVLVISGRRVVEPPKEAAPVRQEIPSGRFYRAFKIGVQVRPSAVKASMADGILEVRLPKSEEAKPNKIKIE